MALSEVVREVASIRNFIIELSLGYELGLIIIRYDSTTTKRLAKNGFGLVRYSDLLYGALDLKLVYSYLFKIGGSPII